MLFPTTELTRDWLRAFSERATIRTDLDDFSSDERDCLIVAGYQIADRDYGARPQLLPGPRTSRRIGRAYASRRWRSGVPATGGATSHQRASLDITKHAVDASQAAA